jgi:hypothetical protein
MARVMRTSRVVACGATGLLVMLAAACSGTASGSQSTSTGHAAYTQLTVAQAYSAYTDFLPKFSNLSAHPADIGQLTTGPEIQVLTASKGSAGPSVSDVTNTQIIVPKLTGYPRWFVAGGTNSTTGQGVVFVLVQHGPGSPWKETAELYDLGSEAQIMPDLTKAGFGATTTTQTEPDQGAPLAIQPAQLPAAYAQYLDNRGAGAQRGKFKTGSYTTGLIKLEKRAAAGAPSAGWKYTDHQAAVGFPQYAVRLPSGRGAAVIFFTVDTATWTASSAHARIPTASYAGLSLPPLQILQALGINSVHRGLRVSVQAVDENLAFIGPTGTSAVTIAANVGRAFKLSKG